MTEDELIAKADDACIFTNDLQVVPLKDALHAIKAEREACAMVCEKRASTYKNPPIDGNEFISGYFQEEAELCAFAIRKRSNAELRGATDD